MWKNKKKNRPLVGGWPTIGRLKKNHKKHMDKSKVISATAAGPTRPLPAATTAPPADARPAAAPGYRAISVTATLTDTTGVGSGTN
jgi:hypothetical protein